MGIPTHIQACTAFSCPQPAKGFTLLKLSLEKTPTIIYTFLDWPVKAIVTELMHRLLDLLMNPGGMQSHKKNRKCLMLKHSFVETISSSFYAPWLNYPRNKPDIMMVILGKDIQTETRIQIGSAGYII